MVFKRTAAGTLEQLGVKTSDTNSDKLLFVGGAIRNKAKEYAIQIVTLCRAMRKDGVEAVLVHQLLRAGTSVGANLHEAQYAQSTKDFISKLEIALKECNESDYWIDLLHEVGNISDSDYSALRDRIIELRRMLVSSVKTIKAKEHD